MFINAVKVNILQYLIQFFHLGFIAVHKLPFHNFLIIKNLVSAPSHLSILCRDPVLSRKTSRKEGAEGRAGPGRWQWLPRAAALAPGCLSALLAPGRGRRPPPAVPPAGGRLDVPCVLCI